MSASIIALPATTRGGLPFGLPTQWLKGSLSWRPHARLVTGHEMGRRSTSRLERSVTSRRCAGVVAAACTQGKRAKHGKPQSAVSDDQPEAREEQAGRLGVAERFEVPLKPGKGPQFKTDEIRGEGPEIGQPINSAECSETTDGVARESKGVKSCPRAGCGRSACPVR